jgi:hypothetical protein
VSNTYRELDQIRSVRAKRRQYRKNLRCVAKRCFPDEITARVAGMVSIQERKRVSKLWIYQCTDCQRWHLTKQDHGRRWLVTAEEPVAA